MFLHLDQTMQSVQVQTMFKNSHKHYNGPLVNEVKFLVQLQHCPTYFRPNGQTNLP